MQLPDEVPEGLGSGGFGGRYLVRFRKVPVLRFRRVLADRMLGEVPEVPGTGAL